MTINEEKEPATAGDLEVREVDESILKDLESRYINVGCPVHGGPPTFEVGPGGAVVERFCCEALLSMVRELQIAGGERPATETAASDRDTDA